VPFPKVHCNTYLDTSVSSTCPKISFAPKVRVPVYRNACGSASLDIEGVPHTLQRTSGKRVPGARTGACFSEVSGHHSSGTFWLTQGVSMGSAKQVSSGARTWHVWTGYRPQSGQ
jgi:hypothetical protein